VNAVVVSKRIARTRSDDPIAGGLVARLGPVHPPLIEAPRFAEYAQTY